MHPRLVLFNIIEQSALETFSSVDQQHKHCILSSLNDPDLSLMLSIG